MKVNPATIAPRVMDANQADTKPRSSDKFGIFFGFERLI
jgi:hypothetical protein